MGKGLRKGGEKKKRMLFKFKKMLGKIQKGTMRGGKRYR